MKLWVVMVKEKLEQLKLEVERLNANVARIRNAFGTLVTWLQRDLGDVGVKQLLEMIE